ncbi:MAG TPA: glutathione S-transferase family protein [Acidiferrobacterales bacterium]|nr:glutathione S-transferase family protein [Acidiferrobacterales bacterium]
MNTTRLELVSFKTCPYVQRAAIVLHEKDVPFEITYIDQTKKPDWFLKISPLGKVPLLKVDDTILFESAVILEYLDEVYPPRLHPADALRRAHNRAWIEFSSTLLSSQFQLLMSPDRAAFDAAAARFGELLDRLEAELGEGPLFNGATLALVDCAFAPLFMRTEIMEPHLGLGAFAQRPRIRAWSKLLLARDSVQRSVVPEFAELLINSWRKRAPLGRELFAERRS